MKPSVKPAKGQDVAKAAPTPLPTFMQQDKGRGTENIGREDMDVPRIKLIQALSPELQQYNSLKAGQFFHTANEEILTGPFRVVPVYFDKRYILWNPRESGGGILARADDGVHWRPRKATFTVKLDRKDGGATVKWRTGSTVHGSGLAEWGSMNPAEPNSSPAATQMLNFVLVFPDRPDLLPAVLTFQRSAIKVGRKFARQLKIDPAPIFGKVFMVNSFIDKNRLGQEFNNVQMRGDGYVTDEAIYARYRDLNQSFTDAGLQVKDLESLQDEAVHGDDEPDDGKDGKPAF